MDKQNQMRRGDVAVYGIPGIPGLWDTSIRLPKPGTGNPRTSYRHPSHCTVSIS